MLVSNRVNNKKIKVKDYWCKKPLWPLSGGNIWTPGFCGLRSMVSSDIKEKLRKEPVTLAKTFPQTGHMIISGRAWPLILRVTYSWEDFTIFFHDFFPQSHLAVWNIMSNETRGFVISFHFLPGTAARGKLNICSEDNIVFAVRFGEQQFGFQAHAERQQGYIGSRGFLMRFHVGVKNDHDLTAGNE